MRKKHSQKVVFLDRDGVINKKPPGHDYVKEWEEFGFLPGAKDAIGLLKQNRYKVFVISNQRGIARGLMTKEDLDKIHKNMQRELEKSGGEIDAIYYCPHNYKDNCDCRKPKPGMFFQAADDHDVDLTRGVFIGDSETDLLAGEAAGVKTILVEPGKDLLHVVKELISS